MLTGKIAIAALLLSLALPGVARAGVRQPSLDLMAEAMLRAGRIPAGPDLLLLGAASGWQGMITSVRMGHPEMLRPPGGDLPYGFCRDDGRAVLVRGSYPVVGLEGVPRAAPAAEVETLAISGLESLADPLVTVLHPSMRVETLSVDSAGLATAGLDGRGIHWLEVTGRSEDDPVVVSLLPLVRGGTMRDALEGELRPPATGTVSAEGVLEEMNALRTDAGLSPLTADSALEEMARSRAVTIAESGHLRHLAPVGAALPDMMRGTDLAYAENIASGAGFAEAWSMILISPTHLASCISPRFTRAGVSAAVSASPHEWQLVLVQVLADGSPEGGER